jgi:hypothetical protein
MNYFYSQAQIGFWDIICRRIVQDRNENKEIFYTPFCQPAKIPTKTKPTQFWRVDGDLRCF